MRRTYPVIAVTTLAAASIIWARASSLADGALPNGGEGFHQLPARQALAAGKWQSQRGAAMQRDWQVQIKHSDDGVISGRVLIAGGRWPQVRLEGRVDGDQVYGVLLDDSGQEVGDFTGSVGKTAASGTYRMKDGDEGNWSTAVGSEPAERALSEASEIPATPAPAP